MKVKVRYRHEISEREIARHLPPHARRQGTDNVLIVDHLRREDADLIVQSMNCQEGVHAEILEDEKEMHYHGQLQ